MSFVDSTRLKAIELKSKSSLKLWFEFDPGDTMDTTYNICSKGYNQKWFIGHFLYSNNQLSLVNATLDNVSLNW